MKICNDICNGANNASCSVDRGMEMEMDDIYISYSKVEPLSWGEAIAQPFLSCGLCQEEEEKNEMTKEMEETTTKADWATLIWHLSGMEFIRISCIEPEVLESLGVWNL
eukprot:CAMPEP_0201948282 /NCGR_PEP_ID=MMETSP0903-20130614/55383_1 /ASSEMBLY_ACC=CAM_ASM_000552 /TAXON_ID=420261 /ORGANISM="Thalassiosira antarctica, Strain CCMP982" /LENGTH=108 /DNA_ID=CAMNT_0048491461 /DNA_START=124 /DNA_END=450 /DNA_ORIENTATION=+